MKKGSLAGITGRIQTSNFEGKDGNRVFLTEVVADSVQFLEPRNASSNQSDGGQAQGHTNTPNQSYNTQNQQQTSNNDPFVPGGGPIEVGDSDLPF